MFAAFTILIHAALLKLSLSLSSLTITSYIIFFLIFLLYARQIYQQQQSLSIQSKKALLGLCLLALLSGTLASSINSPEEDDSLYSPIALQSVENSSDAIRFDMNWIVPFSGDVKFQAKLASLSSGAPYFWAMIATSFNIEHLFAYSVIGAFLFGAAFPVVYFYFISLYVNEERAALFGAVAVTIAGYVLFRESVGGYGSLLAKIWIGKAILAAILIPLAAASSINFLQKPNAWNWGSVFCAGIASTGLSSSSLFLFPMLLMAISLGYLMLGNDKQPDSFKTRIKNSITLGLAGIYPAIAGMAFIFSSEISSIRKYADTIGGGGDLFYAAYPAFFGSAWSVTAICVCIAILYLAIQRKTRCRTLIGWFLATVVLFANPITSGFVALYLTSTVAYVRVFYLIPVFGLVGVAIAVLLSESSDSNRPTILRSFRRYAPTVALLFALIAAAIELYKPGEGWLKKKLVSQNIYKNNIIGSSRIGSPTVRVDPGIVTDILHFIEILPAANTLASIDYAVTIPLFTTKLPQYHLWPLTVLPVYGETYDRQAEALMRMRAGQFLTGSTEFHKEFIELVQGNVTNLIVSKRFSPNFTLIHHEAIKNGFVFRENTDRYLLYSKP
jgi:hypothetical protein